MSVAGYWRTCAVVRGLWSMMGGTEVRGRENIPREGPFLLFANHLSYLDTVLVPATCPRIVHPMAKSTQFGTPLLGRWLISAGAFPVRRFETDPQAVRMALRYLENGEGVLIYVEGERSWDGDLQPPRLGTIRLALKAGVPIVPCRVDGAYEAWPRWHKGIRKRRVQIEFRKPLYFPKLDHKAEREAMIEAAARQIMAAIGPAPTPTLNR